MAKMLYYSVLIFHVSNLMILLLLLLKHLKMCCILQNSFYSLIHVCFSPFVFHSFWHQIQSAKNVFQHLIFISGGER